MDVLNMISSIPHQRRRQVSFEEVLSHKKLFENVIYPNFIKECACKQYQAVQTDRYGGFRGDCNRWYGALPSAFLRNEIDAAEDENREMEIRFVRMPTWTYEGRVALHTIFFVSLRRFSQRDMKVIRKICLDRLYHHIVDHGEQTSHEKNPITILVTGEQKGWVYPNIAKEMKIFCFSAKRDVSEVKSRVYMLLMSFLDARSEKMKKKTESRTAENKWTLQTIRVRLHGILLKDYNRIRGLYHRFRKMASQTWMEMSVKRTSKEKNYVSNIRSTIGVANVETIENKDNTRFLFIPTTAQALH